jgi:Flp pilus assembly protein TadB
MGRRMLGGRSSAAMRTSSRDRRRHLAGRRMQLPKKVSSLLEEIVEYGIILTVIPLVGIAVVYFILTLLLSTVVEVFIS